MPISIINNNGKKNKKIGEILTEGELILKENGNDKAAEESLILLCYLLKKERFDLLLNRFSLVPSRETKHYYNWIQKRCNGMPVQYITGFQNFMGLEFIARKSVFIPRPETEILVEQIIKLIESMPDKTKLYFLDIGVGSGVIPVSICNHFRNTNKNIHFYASDISEKAIELAKDNAKRFSCDKKITFLPGDFFTMHKSRLPDIFDGIISNPPYISKSEFLNLPDDVYYHEPSQALYGGKEGLDYYRKIIYQSSKFLKREKSFLALEIGHKQQGYICSMIENSGYFQENILTFHDYYQNDRVIIALTGK